MIYPGNARSGANNTRLWHSRGQKSRYSDCLVELGSDGRGSPITSPQQFRVFGWSSIIQDGRCGIDFREKTTASAEKFVHGGERRVMNAPGQELGEVTLEDGSKIDAGRALFKGTWNAALHDPLAASFNESQSSQLPDVLFHKNRNSGMCEAMTECTEYLSRKGIRTLLFTGMNTDQCVLSTTFNAQMKGFDTILLNDGCVTDSPAFAQQGCEYQFAKIWGSSQVAKLFPGRT